MTTFAIGGETVVRRLGFGAMRITGEGTWGPPADPGSAMALLRRAVELDVGLIDTADAYGPNVSEELIAAALYPYDGPVIATKGGYERTGPSRRSDDGELLGWSLNGRPEHLRAGNVTVEQLALARSVVEIATVQSPFNLADTSRADLLAECEAHGIGFIRLSTAADNQLYLQRGVI